MANHPAPDDSSHYEVSLTAGQAFIAFILLLCSLGAAFAFGVLVGRGQLDERLVVRREPAVVEEGESPSSSEGSRIVELGAPERSGTRSPDRVMPPREVTLDEFVAPPASRTAATPPPAIIERAPTPTRTAPSPTSTAPPSAASAGPVLAQVLSSSEARAAENLAAKLIEAGFTSAYVERVATPQGMIHRVRVRFPSEAAARAASERLKGLSGGGDVWITRP